MTRWLGRPWALVALSSCLVAPLLRSEGRPQPSPAQMERFLKTAKIIKTKAASKGVTGTRRATLSDGTLTHDASIQSVDESKREFKPDNGPLEINFRDTYKYDIAAYRLGVLLGMDMIP